MLPACLTGRPWPNVRPRLHDRLQPAPAMRCRHLRRSRVGLLLALLVGLAVPASSQAQTTALTAGPTGMRVVGVESSVARLDWASVWPRDYYVAYLYNSQGAQLRRERSNGPDGNTSSHTWGSLAPCTTYQASASFVDGGVESLKSTRVSFKTTGCEQSPPPLPLPGSGTSWAGFANPSALPSVGWRPYAATAAWNRGTAGAQVRPDSAVLVDYLRSTAGGRMGNIPVPDDDGSAPVYYADSDDPQYTIHC